MSHWKANVKKGGKFLFHYDIEGHSPVTLAVTGYEHIDAYNPGTNTTDSLWCLGFKGTDKRFGVNVTNGHLIEGHHGSNPDGWIGKKITLRTAECKGEPCIRVAAKDGAKLPSKLPRFKYTDALEKSDA